MMTRSAAVRLDDYRASAHEHQADEGFVHDPPHLWLIDKLGGDLRSGMCLCPAHDDTNPSLSIGPGTKQPVLLKCFAGCTFEQITAKLRERRLWPVPHGESAAPAQRPQHSDEERKRYALTINNDTAKNHGYENAHLLQDYFAARGIDKVPETAMLALPFAYAEEQLLLPSWGAAMVFRVVDKRNKEIGNHTTWLNEDLTDKREEEPKRQFHGPIKGGHVKLFEGRIADLDPQQPIVVAEGIETAAAMGQLTGYPAISLLSAGNMRDHVELPARPGGYIVGADNHANGSGLKAAAGFARRHATAECPVRIAMPDKPEGADDGFDWNDALRQADADPTALKRAIRKAPMFDPDQYNRQEPRSDEQEALLEELAQLAPFEYARRRGAAAQQLGIGVKFLDDEIKRRRAQVAADAAMDNSLQAPEPWPEPVNGARLMAGLCSILDRHIVLPKGCNVTIALWVLHAHAHDAARHSPILFINSPTKRCGKTQLLETVSRLVPKPLSAANVTPATIFRAIDRWHPTMLIDETDTFLSDKSELRGILNSGHTRSQAYVIRCVGDDLVPKQFSTWAPKAFAAIGRMHPTRHLRPRAYNRDRSRGSILYRHFARNRDKPWLFTLQDFVDRYGRGPFLQRLDVNDLPVFHTLLHDHVNKP